MLYVMSAQCGKGTYDTSAGWFFVEFNWLLKWQHTMGIMPMGWERRLGTVGLGFGRAIDG